MDSKTASFPYPPKGHDVEPGQTFLTYAEMGLAWSVIRFWTSDNAHGTTVEICRTKRAASTAAKKIAGRTGEQIAK